jgi:hypothetical protein
MATLFSVMEPPQLVVGLGREFVGFPWAVAG